MSGCPRSPDLSGETWSPPGMVLLRGDESDVHTGTVMREHFRRREFRRKHGARCRVRTCDPYRVKVVLYH